jgi:hypothetical protein
MADYNVEVRGLDEIKARLKQFPEVAEKRLQAAIDMSLAEMHKNAEQPLVPQRTRNLIKSFGQGIVRGRLFGSIGPRVNYAIFVHEGTKHIKTPNRFMVKIIEKSRAKIDKYFSDALDLITKDLSS